MSLPATPAEHRAAAGSGGRAHSKLLGWVVRGDRCALGSATDRIDTENDLLAASTRARSGPRVLHIPLDATVRIANPRDATSNFAAARLLPSLGEAFDLAKHRLGARGTGGVERLAYGTRV